MDWFILFAVIIAYLLYKYFEHFGTADDRAKARDRQDEVLELRRMGYNTEIQAQYRRKYNILDVEDCYAYWIPERYREYMAKELALWKSAGHPNRFPTAAADFGKAFAHERMIRDHVALPTVCIDEVIYPWSRMQNPTEGAIKLCWHEWHIHHHEELINHYNETGEFIPVWEWEPVKHIPDPPRPE